MSDGNILAGAEKMKRPSIGVPYDLLDEFDAWWPETGYDDRSEAVRALMREATGRNTPDWLPDDDQLATAYQALRRNANPDTGKIGIDAAKAVVAEATQIKKEAVRDGIFPPLEERGLIAPKWEVLCVRFPDE